MISNKLIYELRMKNLIQSEPVSIEEYENFKNSDELDYVILKLEVKLDYSKNVYYEKFKKEDLEFENIDRLIALYQANSIEKVSKTLSSLYSLGIVSLIAFIIIVLFLFT